MNAERAQARWLADGRKLHLQDGPIDLILEATGERQAVEAAYRAAWTRFRGVLDELCAELAALRRPASATPRPFNSPIAAAMERAVAPYAAEAFITPMAAVAGAVADDILAAMLAVGGRDLGRASVNNGGDIALHLAEGDATTIGLVDRPDRPSLFARARIAAGQGVGGVATSGARGRSFSLGIADAVTILARTAVEADAAGTIVANAVDLPGDPRVIRRAAASLQPDSDLGDRLVTRAVAPLDIASIDAALARGLDVARRLVGEGRIAAAALHLQGETRIAANDGLVEARRIAEREVEHA